MWPPLERWKERASPRLDLTLSLSLSFNGLTLIIFYPYPELVQEAWWPQHGGAAEGRLHQVVPHHGLRHRGLTQVHLHLQQWGLIVELPTNTREVSQSRRRTLLGPLLLVLSHLRIYKDTMVSTCEIETLVGVPISCLLSVFRCLFSIVS